MLPPVTDVQRSALDARDRDASPLRDAVEASAAAARVGFDWNHAAEVLGALRAEVEELAEVLGPGPAARHELGDVLLAACNLARHLDLDPHAALESATRRFESRFRRMEADARLAGAELGDLGLPELEARWQAAKAALRAEAVECSD